MLSKHWLDTEREIVESSTLKIPERLKELDSGYFVVRNHSTGRFEIHHICGLPDESFQLLVPYNELDERTIKFAWETRIENAKAIFALMERNNKKLEDDAIKKKGEMVEDIARDTYRYLGTHWSKETLDDGAYTTRFF